MPFFVQIGGLDFTMSERELLASVYQDCEKKEVACFDRRNADHILFVEKYARIAEDRVKILLESML